MHGVMQRRGERACVRRACRPRSTDAAEIPSMNTPRTLSRGVAFVVTALALGVALPSHAEPSNRYAVHNLVTDPGSGISAPHQDANLKNGWGVAFNPTGFVWVADNHTGKSTLYDGSGNVN